MTICQKRNDWQLLLFLCESISYVSREMIDSSFYAYMNQSFFLKSSESVFLFIFYPCKIWTNWCNLLVVNSHFFVCVATIKLLKSLWFFSEYPVKNSSLEMSSLNGNDKIICENYGTPTTRTTLARHKKKCSVETLYYAKCPNFSTGSHADLSFHIAKKHSLSQREKAHKCQLCQQVFLLFSFLAIT